MSASRRLALLLGPLAACLILGAPPAGAADPGVIAMPALAAPAAGQSAPVLATDDGNTTYAAWAESAPDRVLWAQHAYGATAFTAPQTVTPILDPDHPTATSEFGPLIASDGAGNVTVAWTADTPEGTALLAATKLAGGSSFSAPIRIAPASDIVDNPQLFMGDDGSTTLTWTAGVDTFHQRVAIRTAPSGPFGAPFDAFGDGGVADDVAGGRDGTVVFGRTERVDSPTPEDISTVVRKGRGAARLDAPIELTRGNQREFGAPDPTRVAVSDSGITWVSATKWTANSLTPGLWNAAPGSAFTNRCEQSLARDTVIDVDSNGWLLSASSGLMFSRTPSCTTLERRLSVVFNGDETDRLMLTPDAIGGTHLTWTETTAGNPATSRVRTVYDAAGCTVTSTPVDPIRECFESVPNTAPTRTVASGGAVASDASSDRAGNLLVGFWSADGAPSVSVVDREIPQITDVRVEQGSAPLKLRLTLTATDTYSLPVTVSWIVSHPKADGETQTRFFAEGASTEVIVPDPPAGIGVRGSVVARVTDAAGNKATLSRPLPLRPAASPTPAPITLAATLGTARFKALKSGTAVDVGKPKSGRGGALTVTTTTAGTVTLKLETRNKGRKRGSKCSPKARTGKRCAVYVAARGSEAVKVQAGTTTLRVTGRWRGRPLRPGLYRLTLTMPEAPKPVAVTFRIAR